MPYGDTPFGFFCACIRGWIARIYLYFGKTENLKSPYSEGQKSVKIPQILRLAILGDTGIYQVVSALFAEHFLKNLFFFLFLQWVQRRILFCEPSSFEYFLWQSKSYKVIRDFCFHHRCTPENRYCGVTALPMLAEGCSIQNYPDADILSRQAVARSVLFDWYRSCKEFPEAA